MNKSENKVTAYSFISTFVISCIGFISAPLFSRLLGTYNYGIYSIYYTWLTLFNTFIIAGVGDTLGVARYKIDSEKIHSYRSSIIFLGVVFFAIILIVVVVFMHPLMKLTELTRGLLVFLVIMAFFEQLTQFLQTYWLFNFEVEKKLLASIIVAISSLSLSYVLFQFIPSDINYWAVIIGKGIPFVILGSYSIAFFLFKGRVFFDKGNWSFALAISGPLIFHSISNVLLRQTDVVMIQKLMDVSMVGIYSFASTFSAVMMYIFNALNNSWVPFYYKYTKENELLEIKKHSKHYIELFTVLCIGFLLLSKEVFQVFARMDYWSGLSCVPVLVVGTYFVFLYSLCVNYEIYNEKSKIIPFATLIAAAVNVVLNYLLIERYGFWGAALATTLSHLVQFLLHYILAKLVIKDGTEFPYSMSIFLPYLIILTAGVAMFYLFSELWIVRWCFGIIIGIVEIEKIIKRRKIF